MRTQTVNRSFKKWYLSALAWTLTAVTIIVLVNCIVDTYGILWHDCSKPWRKPNERFVKMKYLLGHKDKYDSFLFGSSRARQIDNKKIKNGTYYNMGYSEGLPKEHLDHIKALIQNGVRVKNVIIALDDFSYRVNPDAHLFDLLKEPHYLVSGKRKIDFYGEYFLKIKQFWPQFLDYLRFNYGNYLPFDYGIGDIATDKTVTYDMYDSGRVFCPDCDNEIEKDLEKHNNDLKRMRPYHYNGDNLSRALGDLDELVRFAKKNRINLVILINPIHQTTYRDTDLPLFSAFKKQLAAMTDYYDFSGLNSVTTNNYYYYETSHYRPTAGDMMLHRIFGYPQVVVPNDFGVLVTKQNVDEHLKRLHRQITLFEPHNDPQQSSSEPNNIQP